MKIIIDARTATPHFPGIGRYVSNLLKAMADLQNDVSFHIIQCPITVDDFISSSYQSTTTTASVFSLRQHWDIPEIINNVGGSVYHSTYYLMPFRTRIPVVFTCYDLIPLIYPMYFSPFQRAIYRVAHRMAMKISSHVIAISESTKSDLIKFFSVDNKKVSVIPLAAHTSFQPQSTGTIDVMRSQFGLPRKYCLYLGTNKPHKNLLGLLKGWKFLRDNNGLEDYALIIAGRWDSRYPEVQEFATNAGLRDCVLFAGEIPDVYLPALYSGAAIFVQPSLYEGFGLPIVEAMSCGTPVVCSNTSSLPEVAGDAAIFFNPKNPKNIADVLGSIIANRATLDSLRQKSLCQAAKFSWKKTALHTIEIYRKVYMHHSC